MADAREPVRITEEAVNPFVRCVGCGTGIYQQALYCSYDYRLVYFTEGTGEVLYGGETYRTQVGELYLFAPGTPFAVRCGKTQTALVVNFDWTQNHAEIRSPVLSVEADAFHADKVIEKAELCFLGVYGEVLCLKDFFEAEEILRQLYKGYFTEVKPNGIRLSGLMKQLAGLLADRLNRTQQSREKPLQLASRIIAYIQEQYSRKITLEDASAALHYHATYINRVMKTVTGVSFHQYLLDYRLKQSLQLLEQRALTVEQIAERTGFSNSKHFSTCFKKHYGIAPSGYIQCQI